MRTVNGRSLHEGERLEWSTGRLSLTLTLTLTNRPRFGKDRNHVSDQRNGIHRKRLHSSGFPGQKKTGNTEKVPFVSESAVLFRGSLSQTVTALDDTSLTAVGKTSELLVSKKMKRDRRLTNAKSSKAEYRGAYETPRTPIEKPSPSAFASPEWWLYQQERNC